MKIVAEAYAKKRSHLLDVYSMSSPVKTMKAVKARASKNAAAMMRQFDRKRKAYEIRNQSIRQTGSIAIDRLSFYKTSDEIFKSASYIDDGKSHGIYAIVDFSGSMEDIMHSVIEQAYTIALFAQKAKIPFRIVSFTSGCNQEYDLFGGYGDNYQEAAKSNFLFPDRYVKMNSMFSDTKTAHQNEMIFEAVYMYHHIGHRTYGKNEEILEILSECHLHHYNLWKTPLEDAMLIAYDEASKMKKALNLQNMMFVTITDGSGEDSPTGGDPTGVYVDPYNNNATYQFEYKDSNALRYRYHSVWYANMMQVIQKAGFRTLGIYVCPNKEFLNSETIKKTAFQVHYDHGIYTNLHTENADLMKKLKFKASKNNVYCEFKNFAGCHTFIFSCMKPKNSNMDPVREKEYRAMSQTIVDELCVSYG